MNYVALLSLSSLILAGCAQTPPITTTYPGVRSSLHVRIVQTVGCDEKNWPVSAIAVTQSVTHVADNGKPNKLSFGDIDAAYANSDFKLDFYGDGRLKGINATTTGQGETILKAAIALVEVALEESVASDVETKCKDLKARFKDKPLTLAFETRDDLSGKSNTTPIKPDGLSAAYYKEFKPLFGETCLVFGTMVPPVRPVEVANPDDYAKLSARQPGQIPVAVATGPEGHCEQSVVWSGIVSAAQRGVDYTIPIPKAAFFGKQSIAVGFDEAGGLTLLQYGKESGVASALGAAKAGVDAAQNTRAETIAELKGEADLIAAQQRLVKCQTSPATC